MKLSILMLTYNHGKYLKKAIDSIVNQECTYDFELIISDDASSDNTVDIIKEYISKYPNVIEGIFRSENLGLIKNYFSTLAKCSGEYIMLCSGDDYWLEDKINTQISFMESHPDVLLSHTAFTIVDSNNNPIRDVIYKDLELDFRRLFKENQIGALSVCFKNDLVKKYIAEVNPISKKWSMEDYPFWLWISKMGEISYIPKILCCYRELYGSISHPVDFEKVISYEKNKLEIRLFFAQNRKDQKFATDMYLYNLAILYLNRNSIGKSIKYFNMNNSYYFKIKYIYNFVKEIVF